MTEGGISAGRDVNMEGSTTAGRDISAAAEAAMGAELHRLREVVNTLAGEIGGLTKGFHELAQEVRVNQATHNERERHTAASAGQLADRVEIIEQAIGGGPRNDSRGLAEIVRDINGRLGIIYFVVGVHSILIVVLIMKALFGGL